MTLRYSTPVRSAQNAALIAAIGANGAIKFYTGTQVATPLTTPVGTLLATCLLTTPTVGVDSGGTLTFNPIANDISIDATGTVGWFRVVTSGGVGVIDGAVTLVGGGGEITTPAVLWTATEPLAVSSLVIVAGNL